jgi:dihydroneopterin aldolase
MSEFIAVNKLNLRVSIGCTKEERDWPQFLTIDLKAYLSLEKSAKSDELNDTIDYVALIDIAQTLSKNNSWKLIESFGYDLGKAYLENFPLVSKVEVTVNKKVSQLCESVSASLVVSRN